MVAPVLAGEALGSPRSPYEHVSPNVCSNTRSDTQVTRLARYGVSCARGTDQLGPELKLIAGPDGSGGRGSIRPRIRRVGVKWQ